jgi:putative membrane protein
LILDGVLAEPPGAVDAVRPVRVEDPVIVPLLILSVYGVPYGLRARALRRRGRAVPTGRAVAFSAGVLALAAASALDGAADRGLPAHMLQHLLLGDLAPLLLVAGSTGAVLAPLLRSRPAAVLRPLGHPLVALAAWTLALYAWHLPAAYDAAVRNAGLHALEHACFFLTGLGLWAALLGPLPRPVWFRRPAQLAYVVAAWLIGAVLGFAMVFAAAPFYDAYAGAAGALAGQSTAGALMMVVQSAVAFVLVCRLFLAIWAEAAERQDLFEVAVAARLQVDEERIERAVAARRARALGRRLAAGAEREP